MVKSLLEFTRKHEKILVFGAGGGGDALGALMIYLRVKSLGGSPILGSVVWERYPIDPYPGPLPLESLLDAEPIGWSAALVSGGTVAYRYGSELHFQLARVLEAIGERGLFIDLSKGVAGVKQALQDAGEVLEVTGVIAVDTGGDILAVGCEDNLWSPLADAISLAGLYESNIPSLVAVIGPGSDGELPQEMVLRYISKISRKGGLVEISGLSKYEYEYTSGIMEKVYSEASKMPVKAFSGEWGERLIRGGTRKVKLNPITASIFYLDTVKTYDWSRQAQEVIGTRGIGQAKERLNNRCIVTELDLELELSRLREKGSQRSIPIDEIRRELRRRFMLRGCNAVTCPG